MAYNYMMLFGNTVSFLLRTKLSIGAQRELDAGADDRYYNQKIATAIFFATQILTRNNAYLASLQQGAETIVELGAEDFVTQ